MAGSFVSIDLLGDEAITNALNTMLARGLDLAPAFYEMGEHILESTQDRMDNEKDPNGNTWKPLKLETILRKQKTGQSDKILRGYGTLADMLSYQLGSNQLMFGSNMIYAAKQQFEYEREFIGVSSDDETEIIDILRSHLSGA